MPTPFALKRWAAVIRIRPSPHPRSYTVSPGLITAKSSMRSTMGCGEAINGARFWECSRSSRGRRSLACYGQQAQPKQSETEAHVPTRKKTYRTADPVSFLRSGRPFRSRRTTDPWVY